MQSSARSLRFRIVESLSFCQNTTGGFGGGNKQVILAHILSPMPFFVIYMYNFTSLYLYLHIFMDLFSQFSHCAPTYAAVLALMSLGGVTSETTGDDSVSVSAEDDVLRERAFSLIDRPALYSFFLSLKDEASGGFRMHQDGKHCMFQSVCRCLIMLHAQVRWTFVAHIQWLLWPSCSTY